MFVVAAMFIRSKKPYDGDGIHIAVLKTTLDPDLEILFKRDRERGGR